MLDFSKLSGYEVGNTMQTFRVQSAEPRLDGHILEILLARSTLGTLGLWIDDVFLGNLVLNRNVNQVPDRGLILFERMVFVDADEERRCLGAWLALIFDYRGWLR
jgi:hypothetical protein